MYLLISKHGIKNRVICRMCIWIVYYTYSDSVGNSVGIGGVIIIIHILTHTLSLLPCVEWPLPDLIAP